MRKAYRPFAFSVMVLSMFVFLLGKVSTQENIIPQNKPYTMQQENKPEAMSPIEPPPIIQQPEIVSLGEFELTAYCPCVKCCGIWSSEHPKRLGTDYIQKTASGTIPTAGKTIGVDPGVISFGTTVLINGEEYIAEDKGGSLKNNRIDIFFNSHSDALSFGRKTAEVYIKNLY